MKIGSFTIEILSEGQFEIFADGHINRTPRNINEAASEKYNASDDNSVMAGINPVLIHSDNHNILLDTGLGWGLDTASKYTDVSNVCTNLRIFGLMPEDITHVVLSHLHYDHAAGSTFTDGDTTTKPTFPNAQYFVHQQEWDFALSQVDQPQNQFGANYQLDDFYRLVADDKVTFLSDEINEIINGVMVIRTGGHTPGHQIIKIGSGNETAYFLGDLLPTSFHLNQYMMHQADIYSLEAKKQKVRLLKQACNEKALLFFYHSKNGQAGRVFRDKDKKYVLAKQLP